MLQIFMAVSVGYIDSLWILEFPSERGEYFAALLKDLYLIARLGTEICRRVAEPTCSHQVSVFINSICLDRWEYELFHKLSF